VKKTHDDVMNVDAKKAAAGVPKTATLAPGSTSSRSALLTRKHGVQPRRTFDVEQEVQAA
jgi:pre-mRNA-splicing helicase BRR2